MAQGATDAINFVKEEEAVLKLWKEIDAFQTSLKLSKGKPKYSFYDGPPFATGLPHYGHILAGTLKDVVTRWAHQSGFHVERRFGWDCHGLPVEYEIDKTLGIKGPEDVAKMGIKAYNDECRKIVQRYSQDWKDIMSRLARWIDFDNDYRTMYPSFMETIWWVFKQLYNKGLVYKGYKVMPFSTACNTPLSNFESGQNYKEVVDPAVIVSFPLEEDPKVSIIAWTTTPWTLPSNLALCVHPDLSYVKVKDKSTKKVYIMMEARLPALFKTEEEYMVMEKFPGKTLGGKKYTPLFEYFKEFRELTGAFRVVLDTYVTTDAGTGIVHQAPYFGEDDQRVCLANGIISKDMKIVCPVDPSGRFTEEVTDFKGMYVKDADKEIVKNLKGRGRLVQQSTIKHSYPFCWRSETPLIYKAVPSWFVRVEHAVDKLLASNSQTYWVPEFVKDKRFGNWLKDARDWAISRNRYWGNPMPLWVSDDGEEVVCVGSIEELTELTGTKVDDLHRDFIDDLTIPSKTGRGVLRRVPEVFDCWFESGSMPYGKAHFPFENRKEFEDNFPADFIAEGIDQTRGWFYTLIVVSTLLFGKPPFKNLVCNGLVLAQDGQKMSKRKKNYPDPLSVVEKYGADAIRLYLVNSPAVRAENLRFKEQGVRDILKDVFLPWYNAYRFLAQYVDIFEQETGEKILVNEKSLVVSDNYMDRWIISFIQSLIKFVEKEMAEYRLYTVTPRLVKFIDQLTNWYLRMNRRRLKGDTGREDCRKALETLCSVIFSISRMMAPFTPFLTETIYQGLRKMLDLSGETDARSIHFLMLPKPREQLIHQKIETAVSRMQSVIELGRVIRDRKTLPVKYPLKEVVAIVKNQEAKEDLVSLEKYILEELNVHKLTVTLDKDQYGVRLRAEPDHRQLGQKLTSALGTVTPAIKALTDEEIEKFQAEGTIEVKGYTLETGDLRILYNFDKEGDTPQHYDAHSDGKILVLLDTQPDESMLNQGVAREVINRVQKLRKKAKLQPTDNIEVYYRAAKKLVAIIEEFSEFINSTVKQPLKAYPVPDSREKIITESMPIKTDDLEITITWSEGGKREISPAKVPAQPSSLTAGAGDALQTDLAPAPAVAGVTPNSRFVNAVLVGLRAGQGRSGSMATILLDNPAGSNGLTMTLLVEQAQCVFGLRGVNISLFSDAALKQPLKPDVKLDSLAKKTIYVALSSPGSSGGQSSAKVVDRPVCHFANVEGKGKKGTLLLENPRGDVLSLAELQAQAAAVLNSSTRVQLSAKKDKSGVLTSSASADILALHGKTLTVL
ncbi:isoleucine--tRNA ligase, cytoplasmic [Aplysia californica]|uniref:isoleucine--tRNA ligase n=1 Tax=Aplysia californica TaxID=6500 RepID=A0ABM0K6V6_APLCA|nr:isoleucine--tRNA ligase, cytoplasmic [Aplysia californica]XP_005110127.1 isoleucine--tRNA ligase, cytoplasmic [Aplysia californica]XP_005110129.1 isoleucine--tRNA ligase, cytoplasmic [Aplysia californica]